MMTFVFIFLGFLALAAVAAVLGLRYLLSPGPDSYGNRINNNSGE